jgi:hypothetical protein
LLTVEFLFAATLVHPQLKDEPFHGDMKIWGGNDKCIQELILKARREEISWETEVDERTILSGYSNKWRVTGHIWLGVGASSMCL